MITKALASHFCEVIDKSSAPILVVNCGTGIIVYANQAGADLHGFSPDEFVGKSCYDFTVEPESTNTAWNEKIRHTPLRYHRKKDGSIFPSEVYRGFFALDGASFVTITLFDITARLQTASSLAEQNRRWEIACEATNSGIWDRDLRTEKVYRSPRWYQILGYEPSDFTSSAWLGDLDLIHPDDLKQAQEVRRLHLAGQLPLYDIECRVRRKDGSYLWCSSRGKALRDENGVPYRMIGFLTDIQLLADSREKLLAQNRILSILHEVSLSVIQAPDQDREKSIGAIARHASDYFNADIFFLASLDATGERMVNRTSLGPISRKNQFLVRGQFLSGRAWETGEIQIQQNYQNWAGRWEGVDGVKLSTGIAVPMRIGDRVVGVFSLGFFTPREFSADDLQILRQFAAIGALLAQTSYAEHKFDSLISKANRIAFLNLLVSGDAMSREDLFRRAGTVHIPLKGSYVALTIEPDIDDPKQVKSPLMQSPWLPFLDVVQENLAPGIVWDRNSALNVLFPVDKDCTGFKEFSFTTALNIRSILKSCLPEMRFSIGIGNYYSDILDIHRSYKEAREALDTGRRLGGSDGIHHYLDIGIIQMLARMGRQGPIQAFVDNTIGRLLDYDRRRKGQFLPTLEMILTGKSLRVIAEEMNVHQKTIVFRKMRIEEILNLPIDEGDVRLNLSIALKLHKVHQSIEAEKQSDPVEKKKRKPRRRRGEKSAGDEPLNAELGEIEPDK